MSLCSLAQSNCERPLYFSVEQYAVDISSIHLGKINPVYCCRSWTLAVENWRDGVEYLHYTFVPLVCSFSERQTNPELGTTKEAKEQRSKHWRYDLNVMGLVWTFSQTPHPLLAKICHTGAAKRLMWSSGCLRQNNGHWEAALPRRLKKNLSVLSFLTNWFPVTEN